jgi:hypothetical protein
MNIRTDIDNSGLFGCGDGIPEEEGEIKMSKMIDSKCHLYTLLVILFLIHRETSIII